jgi:hypothetical protein
MRRAICYALAFAVVMSVELGAAEAPTRPGFAPPDSDRIGSEVTVIAADSRPEANAEAAAAEPPIDGVVAGAEVYVGPYDHVAAGTGLRNAGYGTIRLRGTPDGAKKKQAFLYLGIICETATCAPKRTLKLNGVAVSMTLIATSVEPCWADFVPRFGVYRADVTAKVPAGIDGDYKITGAPSGVKTGSDPRVAPASPLPLADGATLVVVYSTPTLTPGAVYIHHGAVSFHLHANFTLPLSPPPTGTVRRYTSFGGDGEISNAAEETWIGNADGTYKISGAGALKKADHDWSGSDGWYWDTHTQDVSTYIPADSSAYVVRFQIDEDCVVSVGHVLTAR